MKVLKFGGTSVGSPAAIRALIEILLENHRRNERFCVVFSAFSKVTDSLLLMAHTAEKGDPIFVDMLDQLKRRHIDAALELLRPDYLEPVLAQLEANFEALHDVAQGIYLLREASLRSLDFVAGFGERNSTFIVAQAMLQAGIPTVMLDARQVVKTDAHFGAAKVDFETTNTLIRDFFAQHPVQSIATTGFIGSTPDGLTTTLGRGGSDYTAAIFGAALDASAIEIWTDVDGVMTADPRRVKKAFTLPSVTYREAMEMSHFGAKVIYPPTILPALAKHIPLVIRNTFNPAFPGTFIGASPTGEVPIGAYSERALTGISSINQICLLTLQGSALFGMPGISGRLFGALARAGVNVVIITQGSSESSITFAVSPTQADAAKKAVEIEFAYEMKNGQVDPLRIERDLSVVAAVGEGMRYRPGVAGRLFQALGKNGVNVVAIAQGSSELNVSIVVPAHDETKALNAIHEAFFLSDTHTLHLYIVGVGLIGATLLRQIAEQAAFLRRNRQTEIKVVGLANSKRMLFSEDGIDLQDWESSLRQAETPFSMVRLVEQMRSLNLPNTIFVDNTGSSDIAGYYEQILEASISISTPNKQAASGSMSQYRALKQTAAKRGVQWRYETNVGAGLPIINTLNDLMTSGDRIIRIEGILSGTLAYLFNHFDAVHSFSSVVAKAKALGLTEPDPRDDLSGADVRRKLLILARESGLSLESADIVVENILPESCIAAPDTEAFMAELARYDDHFEQMRAAAADRGCALRMVARLENGQARIALGEYPNTHPFYFLSGSDNMVVFTTERYKERPLVVRGPGAGAEVTAAGVFAEIISIGNYLS